MNAPHAIVHRALLDARASRRECAMKGSVQHLDPGGLHRNPAYSQAIVVTGPVKTVYVGGQNAVDAAGKIVGKGDLGAQSEQVLKNARWRPAGRGWSMS